MSGRVFNPHDSIHEPLQSHAIESWCADAICVDLVDRFHTQDSQALGSRRSLHDAAHTQPASRRKCLDASVSLLDISHGSRMAILLISIAM